MSSPFNEIKKTLEGRWKPAWSVEVRLHPAARAYKTSLNAVTSLKIKANGLRHSGKFSETGLQEEVRAYAKAETVPALKQSAQLIEQIRTGLAERRAKLAIPTPDPTNAAQAMVRSEMRGWLRTLSGPQRMAALLAETADERMLQAAIEAPAIMSGLTEDDIEKVQANRLQVKHGPELARIDELSEAVDVAGSAVQISLYELRKDAGFNANDDALFDKWMGEASDEAENAEAAKTTDELVQDFEVQLDQIFAKGFPEIYGERTRG